MPENNLEIRCLSRIPWDSLRVLPSTAGTRQYLFRNRELRRETEMFTNAIKCSHLRPEKPQPIAATAHRICDYQIAYVTLPRGGVSPPTPGAAAPPCFRGQHQRRFRARRRAKGKTAEIALPQPIYWTFPSDST